LAALVTLLGVELIHRRSFPDPNFGGQHPELDTVAIDVLLILRPRHTADIRLTLIYKPESAIAGVV